MQDNTQDTTPKARLIQSDSLKAKLVEETLPEALEYVGGACQGQLPKDEQLSIAGNALMRAVQTFDPERSERLIIYARPFLRGGVAQAWRDREPVNYGNKLPEKPDPLAEPKPLVPDYGFFDFDDLTTAERMAYVRPLLNRLSEAERRVLVLTYEAGFTLQQIGDLHAITRSAVQRTHAEAVKKLRHWLMELPGSETQSLFAMLQA